MPEKIYKTTKADYNRFVNEVKYWVDFFGLKDFEVYCDQEIEGEDTSRAMCFMHHEGKIATLTLNPEWQTPFDESEIRKVAFHEVMEMMLSPLWIRADRRYVSAEEIEIAKHEIIRRLENCVWRYDWDKRRRKGRKK